LPLDAAGQCYNQLIFNFLCSFLVLLLISYDKNYHPIHLRDSIARPIAPIAISFRMCVDEFSDSIWLRLVSPFASYYLISI
jgi:hypothetical protein